MKKIKKIKRKTIIILLVNVLLLLLLAACLICYNNYADLLLSQQADQRWKGDSDDRFAQVSCFLPVDSILAEADIVSFRTTMDSKLVEASLKAPENSSLWIDAFAAFSELSVTGERGSATAMAIGVGGDYFFFHPLVLRDGSYLSSNDFMQDRVVLDEELAWKLFGSVDLAGLQVTINNAPYYIAGVVSRENDKMTGSAYDGGAAIYVAYSVLEKATDVGISCYEVVLPDPISGFAVDLVKNSFKIGSGEIIENSARYNFTAVYSILADFAERTMRSNGVAYPYWENAARLTESHMAVLLPLMFLLAAFPTGCIVFILIKQYLRLLKKIKKRKKEDLQYQ